MDAWQIVLAAQPITTYLLLKYNMMMSHKNTTKGFMRTCYQNMQGIIRAHIGYI